MTIQPEMKFRCDRCSLDLNVPLNDQPASNRATPPEGWIGLWVEDTTNPARHLCPTCKTYFIEFMRATR